MPATPRPPMPKLPPFARRQLGRLDTQCQLEAGQRLIHFVLLDVHQSPVEMQPGVLGPELEGFSKSLFRFLEPAHIAGAMEDAGLGVEARLERTSYPEEHETRRGYLLARRRS